MIEKAAITALENTPHNKLRGIKAVEKGLGKSIGNYFKTIKGIGIMSNMATIITTISSIHEYYNNGGNDPLVYCKYGLDIAVSWGGVVLPFGFALTTGYFLLDTVTEGFGIDTTPQPKNVTNKVD